MSGFIQYVYNITIGRLRLHRAIKQWCQSFMPPKVPPVSPPYNILGALKRKNKQDNKGE